jgi:hypothetical protein
MPTWKEQVKICTNTGLFEGSLDDEYSWRKYGQKDILGAKFSRLVESFIFTSFNFFVFFYFVSGPRTD